MPLQRENLEFKTFEELEKENDYIPVHISFIGLTKFKHDFMQGESLFLYKKPKIEDLDDDIYWIEYDDEGEIINHTLAHIFEGDRKGGYHSSSEQGIGDKAEEVKRNRSFGKKGAYKAEILNNTTSSKTNEKTMFPKSYTREQVIKSITEAFINCTYTGKDMEWIGKDSKGMEIKLILNDTFQIVTCWPFEKK